jgi:hypothetical protein
MKSRLETLAVAALVLAASSGCAHRTTTVHRTSETVRTDTGRPEVTPTPSVDESTTIKKHSHTGTEVEE